MSIPTQVLKGLKDLAKETAEKSVDEAGKIVTGVITGGELVGNIKPMTPEEETRNKKLEEIDKQKKLDEVRSQMERGRNVEAEMKQVVEEKDNEEKEKERIFLENLRKQREEEEAERQQLMPQGPKKRRGSAFVQGKKKSQPQADQLTATGEFKGKVD